MTEIVAAFVGAIIGAVLAGLIAILQRSYEEWRSFQQEIGRINDWMHQVVERAPNFIMDYTESIKAVSAAVYRVRPYIFSSTEKDRLLKLLNDYRNAASKPESRMLGAMADPAKPPENLLPDFRVTKSFLGRLLTAMEGVRIFRWI